MPEPNADVVEESIDLTSSPGTPPRQDWARLARQNWFRDHAEDNLAPDAPSEDNVASDARSAANAPAKREAISKILERNSINTRGLDPDLLRKIQSYGGYANAPRELQEQAQARIRMANSGGAVSSPVRASPRGLPVTAETPIPDTRIVSAPQPARTSMTSGPRVVTPTAPVAPALAPPVVAPEAGTLPRVVTPTAQVAPTLAPPVVAPAASAEAARVATGVTTATEQVAGRSLAGTAAKFVPVAGEVFTLGTGIYDGFQGYQQNDPTRVAGAIGGTGGTLAAGWAGAELGATAGAFGGPLAWITVPAGAIIGGGIGAVSGYFLGSWGGKQYLTGTVQNVMGSPTNTTPQAAVPPPGAATTIAQAPGTTGSPGIQPGAGTPPPPPGAPQGKPQIASPLPVPFYADGEKSGVHFGFDDDRVGTAGMATIENVAKKLKEGGFVSGGSQKIVVTANCDEIGSSAYNMDLGNRRARATIKAEEEELKKQGINITDDDFIIKDNGKNDPYEKTGRRDARNRNVEIGLANEKSPTTPEVRLTDSRHDPIPAPG